MEINETPNHDHASASLKIVLLVFAIVLVGALGYLVWAQNTEPDTTDNTAPAVKNTTAITTSAESADWETYSNSTYSFSFKHPKDWVTKEDSDTSDLAEPWKSYDFDVDFTPPGASDHMGYIGVSKKTATQLGAVEYPSNTSKKTEDVTINGVGATKISYTTVGGTYVQYYVVKGSYTFSITGSWTGSDVPSTEESANLKVLDQIMSTFKLL